MVVGVEEERIVIEIISTLVNIKSTMATMLLKPAGIHSSIYAPLFTMRDETTGRELSKRKLAPLLLDAIRNQSDYVNIVCNIIKIASEWKAFHLAYNEYEARATVQKAREIMGNIELMEAREAKQRELARNEEIAKIQEERAAQFAKESELLSTTLDDLFGPKVNPQERGYVLQGLLIRVFGLHDIPMTESFTRNDGGEQIDGAFMLDGWFYLVECRWREKLANIRELDGLRGQVDRSSKQTMGLFLSINGWSTNVCDLLKQNPSKSIILMNGYDLRVVLSNRLNLRNFIVAKAARLSLKAEPFLGVQDYLGGI